MSRRRVILGLLFLLPAALGRPVALRAQIPAQWEPLGLDFRTDGAWRRRARSVREERAALLRVGDFTRLNAVPSGVLFQRAAGAPPSGVAVTGDFFVPVVLIGYSDVPVRFTVEAFRQALFAEGSPGQAYSLKSFYEELSGRRITLNGQIFDPITTDTTAFFFEDGCNGLTILGATSCPVRIPSRLGVLLTSVLDKLSNLPGGDTLWSRFDNDGPDGLPNSGDDDGFVDFVTFLQPNTGGECRNGATGIWSHRWQVSGATRGSPYVTRTPRLDASGQPIPGAFLLIEDYTIQSQLGGTTGCDPSAIFPVGTIAHETGHAFGLPDLYDLTGATSGIGEWGLMGSGNFSRAYSPSTYEAWSLMQLGWITVAPLTEDAVIQAGPRQFTDTIYFAQATNPDIHVLIENRQAVQSDTAQMNPAYTKAKSPGLLLWKVDQSVVDTRYGSINSAFPHGLSLMQADGKNDLDRRVNRGDTGDSYPGTSARTAMTLGTAPSALDNDGVYLGFIIHGVEPLPGQQMRFRFTRREPTVVQSSRPSVVVQVNGAVQPRYTEVIPAGEAVMVSADSIQTAAGGATLAEFASWSNGLPRSHSFVSGLAPDTVTASFTASHRLRVSTVGLGQVVAEPTADLNAGTFLAEGVPVRLTATAPTGVVFLGWTGDTTTTARVLDLRMDRPYTLTAKFLVEVAVSTSEALSELLGTATLSTAQKEFLDAFGNGNGGFDLGDYLALLRRSAGGGI